MVAGDILAAVDVNADRRESQRVRFGPYVADFSSFELKKNGTRLRLQNQPFQILRLLLTRPGRLVTREELRSELWSDNTFVDFEAGLNASIRRLRSVLNDSAEQPRYIETLPRHGYRFIAEAEVVAAHSSQEHSAISTLAAETIQQSTPPPKISLDVNLNEANLLRWPAALLSVSAAVVVLFLIATLLLPHWREQRLPTQIPKKIESIAVLPLENLTGDPQREFFVDGMTETLITELAQIHSLRVTSRTSSLQFKNAKVPLNEIAKQLHVDALIEGAVLESGRKVRISVQLIKAENDKHLWAKEYLREGRDIVNVQTEIARSVAAEIPVRLLPDEERRLRRDRPVNPQAYEVYLEGEHYWKKRTVKDLYKSVECFERATKLDPAWAPGYAGLAEAYVMLGYGLMVALPPDEAAKKALTFATRAIELDGTLAAPHAVLGVIKHRHDWDWQGAESEFQQAIALDPSYVSAHYWYAMYFESLERREEELTQLNLARHLDPTYPLVLTGLGNNQEAVGHHEDAVSFWKEAISLDDANWVPHNALSDLYAKQQDYAGATQELRRVLELSDGNLRIKASLARIYVATGRRAEARHILREIQGKPNSAFSMAEVYVALGEKEKALDYLQKAVVERCGWAVFLRMKETLVPLRGDARFRSMVREIGIPTG